MSAGADRLFGWRLAPAAAAAACSLTAAASFARFEPRAGVERTGVVLMALAAAAVVILGSAIARLATGFWITRRSLRAWTACAAPGDLPDVPMPSLLVDSPFPIVAVVGILRPRLIVARSVVNACSADEWRAIAAHEAWHLRRRDNARRALIAAAPDALAWLPCSRRAARRWSDAAEAAADRAAVHAFPEGRVSLASALVRVARLLPADQPASIPATALYRGESLDVRLRRILEDPAVPNTGRTPARPLIVAAVLIAGSMTALRPIHELLEWAVGFLP
jgi:Zn-dependent protease with chaperone function